MILAKAPAASANMSISSILLDTKIFSDFLIKGSPQKNSIRKTYNSGIEQSNKIFKRRDMFNKLLERK